jgi:DNA mismatch repair protein MutL
MPLIERLSASVINKIAAGEVIERPASVVKELMENAVDSGATRIDAAIEQGGGELVRVADNGCGMPADQLPLAVASHATSKIQTADDLFAVQTMGFRGEALASIAEVSRLVIRSRTPDNPAGAELEVVGGDLRDPAPCGCPPGTILEVRSLFYNTPVRRKFLRTTQTETGHCSEAFTRIAVAHPDIHFTLRNNDRVLHDLPPVDDWRERIAKLFGDELAESLIDVDSGEGETRVAGFVANPTHSRANNRLQYLLLNGRHIRDRALQHALSEAYRGLLLTGRYPICFLRIEMPADQIDVNVHPTKLEVRFADGGRVYSKLLGTLRTRFLTTDLTPRVGATGGAGQGDAEFASGDHERAEQARRELVDWAKQQLSEQSPNEPASEGAPTQSRFELPQPALPSEPLVLNRLDRPAAAPWDAADIEDELEQAQAAAAFAPRGRHESAALQVHNRYLVAESDEGLVVIDQHALHERILYEQLREKVLSGELETQNLLVPEPVDLTPAEAAAVLDQTELLGQLGVKVEPFGGDTVLVSGYPAMLANLSPAEVLRDVVDHLLSGGKAPDRRDLLDSLLHMISCKAAIKAGDRLSHAEIDALLEQRHLAQDAHHCPHGRPTALVFTRDQLDRQFKRI